MSTQPFGTTGAITIQNQNVASGIPTAGSFVQLGLPGVGSSVGAPTAPDIALDPGASTVSVGVSGTYTGALTVRGTADGIEWFAIGPNAIVNQVTGIGSGTIPSGATGLYTVNVVGLQAIRVNGESAMTGTANVSITQSVAAVSPPAAINQPGSGASTLTVAAATGTAIKATAGYLVKVIVVTSGSAATLIYDNASANSGTVIGAIPASPTIGTVYTFNMPAANGIYAGTTNTSSFTALYD
jgi:hypothetical protein